MDLEAIGERIKELRKKNKISQGELAEGVCTQALISRIEKGQVLPSGSVFYHISRKLGTDMNDLFEIGLTPRLDYIREVKEQLYQMRTSHRYKEMMEIVRTEEQNPLFQKNAPNLQLLLWHKGIYLEEVEKDSEQAYDTYKQALELTITEGTVLSEREIEIYQAIAVLHFNKMELDKAMEIYQQIETSIDKLPFLHDITVKTRLYNNIARTLTRLGKLDESLEVCKKGIKWCLENDSLYLLGNLQYHIGYNYELMKDYERAVNELKYALKIFNIQRKELHMPFIEKKIKEVEELI